MLNRPERLWVERIHRKLGVETRTAAAAHRMVRNARFPALVNRPRGRRIFANRLRFVSAEAAEEGDD
jgi:hypothetical protein